MNLFQKYGIKEVADVVFYSITEIGEEEFYTPVLFLDTLKVSTLEKTAEKVEAFGGKGNKKLITWNFGKNITLELEDALFSPASMSMIWGGRLDFKLSIYTSTIVKCNITNKYAICHYSTKAYPSPELTKEEMEVLFAAAQGIYEAPNTQHGEDSSNYSFENDNAYVAENRQKLLQQYYTRSNLKEDLTVIPQKVIQRIIEKIKELKDIGEIKDEIYELEVIDRMEKCIVKKKDGQKISIYNQREGLKKYYADDRTSSFTIFYDAKTMLPLLPPEDQVDVTFETATEDNPGEFKIKLGTIYYKWTRTIKRKEEFDDSILGRTFVINADTFPGKYRIVGETYIRNQKTGKDERYQFTIYRANVTTDTNITLEAEGDPTTFSMSIDVLVPPNDIMMELKQYDVEEDIYEGGTRIIPQKSKYTYTPIEYEKVDTPESNDEIY